MNCVKRRSFFPLFLVFCFLLGLMPVTVRADGGTVTIEQGDTVAEIQTLISGALAENGTVNVIGEKTNVNSQLTLDIPIGKNVIWEAVYETDESYSGDAIRLTGGGEFEVSGGIIAATGNTIYSTVNSVTVSGGTVISSNERSGLSTFAIFGAGAGHITVSGGTVSSNGSSASNGTIRANGPITVSGGTVSSKSGIALQANSRTSVTVSSGLVTAPRRVIFCGVSGTTITISGGLVFSYNDVIIAHLGVIFVSDPDNLIVTGGMVIAWNHGAGITYLPGDTAHITSMPSVASAVWANNGDTSGIAYANGSNTGFIPLPVFVGGDPDEFMVLDLSEPNPHGGTVWTYFNNVYTVTGDIIVTGSTTTKRLKVQPGANVNITLDNAVANSSFDIAGATVSLTLIGSSSFSGVHVPPGASLTIDGPGSLTSSAIADAAIGGARGSFGGDWGIPGGPGEQGGSVTINGGVVTAISQLGSGIGGGAGGNGGGPGGGGPVGAGGKGGAGGTLTINGGTLTAISQSGAAIGSGADGKAGGIGDIGGANGDDGTISIPLPSYRWWASASPNDPSGEGTSYPPTAYAHSNIYKFVKIVAEGEVSGVAVAGTVRSFNPLNETTVQLLKGDQIKYETIIPAGTRTTSQADQVFVFEGVAPGSYSLVISKTAHTRYIFQTVDVDSDDINLTPGTRGTVPLTLLCGDINGNGMINDQDLTILWMDTNYNRSVATAANPLCDLNGDGMINDMDLTILWMSANYNKGDIVIG